MTEKLKRLKWKNFLNCVVVAAFTLVFGVLSLTGSLNGSSIILIERIAISILLAVSLSVVVGFLGELSLGHAGFMCIGAYLGGKAAALLDPVLGTGVLSLLISLLVGGVCAAVCGLIIGLPALRLRGDYLAIVTLAFGEIVRSLFMNSSDESFGGALGLETPRFDKQSLFIYAFLLVLLCLVVIQNLLRSKHGRAITAIRDNEIAARATGINVTYYKLLVFSVSAFFAGLAGVLYSFSNFTVQSGKFGYNYSIEILVMVVLGGMGSINGSMISAALITFLDVNLQTLLTGDMAVLKNFLYALILIGLVLYNNAPALKGFREKYRLRAVMERIRERKPDPSKERDDEAKWDRVPTKIDMDEVLSVSPLKSQGDETSEPGEEERP